MLPAKPTGITTNDMAYTLERFRARILSNREEKQAEAKQSWLTLMVEKYPVSPEENKKSYKKLSLLRDLLDLKNGQTVETFTLDFTILNELPIDQTQAVQLICQNIKSGTMKTIQTDLELCLHDTQKDLLQETLSGSNCTLKCNKPFGRPKTKIELIQTANIQNTL